MDKYEPPPLSSPDADSDTRVPVEARAAAMGMAQHVLDLKMGEDEVELAILAAIESAYADGFDAGVRSNGRTRTI